MAIVIFPQEDLSPVARRQLEREVSGLKKIHPNPSAASKEVVKRLLEIALLQLESQG